MPIKNRAMRYGIKKGPPPNLYAKPGKRQTFPKPTAADRENKIVFYKLVGHFHFVFIKRISVLGAGQWPPFSDLPDPTAAK